MQYGLHAGLDSDNIDAMVLIIRQMDEVFLKWHDAEAKRTRQMRDAGPPTVPARKPKMLGG